MEARWHFRSRSASGTYKTSFQFATCPLRSARFARCAAEAALTPASAGQVGLLAAADALDPVGQVQQLAVGLVVEVGAARAVAEDQLARLAACCCRSGCTS